MACHAHYTVCKRWEEMENTKLRITISKLLAICTVLQEQCPWGLRLFWNMAPLHWVIVSRRFEWTQCFRNVGNRLPINQRHIPHRWSSQPRPHKNFKICDDVSAGDVARGCTKFMPSSTNVCLWGLTKWVQFPENFDITHQLWKLSKDACDESRCFILVGEQLDAQFLL